jgi:tRNA (guanine37-N1)-methyltransferase
MRIDILTLFPDAVMGVLGTSILGRAAKKGAVAINAVQIRDFTENKQQQVDDYPYGGGWGCVMMAQPLKSCLDSVLSEAQGLRSRVIYLSPQGKRFDQTEAKRLVRDYDHLVLVCGHYEGVDERFIETCCDEELSMGDFVLTGGEIPAMAVADCVCRMVPGVLSDPECYEGESHWDGLLEYPQYTRPEVWEGKAVPPVLLQGNHADVEAWRRERQLSRTQKKRPDLFEKFKPRTKADRRTVERLTGTEKLRFDCFKAEKADMGDLLAIAADASALLKKNRVDQWQDGFPNERVFLRDITKGNCWLFTHQGRPAGVISVYLEPDENYSDIQGAWRTDGDNYGVIHRAAVKAEYRGKGLANEMLQLAEDIVLGSGKMSVRADTHEDNKAMRGLLESRGYEACGVVWLKDGEEACKKRIGYEKVF